MSGWNPQNCKRSDWYGTLCIYPYQTTSREFDPEWCRFAQQVYNQQCENWSPNTRQNATEAIKDYLQWSYGGSIRAWAKSCGLGSRWYFNYQIWWKGNGNRAQICGNIQGRAIGGKRRWGGANTRKNRNNRKATTRRNA